MSRGAENIQSECTLGTMKVHSIAVWCNSVMAIYPSPSFPPASAVPVRVSTNAKIGEGTSMSSDDDGLLERPKRDRQRMTGSGVDQAQRDVVDSTQTDSLSVTIAGSATSNISPRYV